MELIYLWIEKLGNRNNQSINFNQNYTFKLNTSNDDQTYELIFIENQNKIPENYFGNKISNISCIIGENGNGKTTLMKDVLDILDTSNLKHFKKNYFLIFKENNTFKIFTNLYKPYFNLNFITKEKSTIFPYQISFFSEDILDSTFFPVNISINNHKLNKEKFNFFFELEIIPLYFSNIYHSSINLKNNISFDNFTQEICTITPEIFFNLFNMKKDLSILKFIIENDTLISKIPYSNLKKRINKMKKEDVFNFSLKNNYYNIPKQTLFDEIYRKIKPHELINKTYNKEIDFKNNLTLKIWKDIIYQFILFTQKYPNSLNELKSFSERSEGENTLDWLKKQYTKLKKLMFFKKNPNTQKIINSPLNNKEIFPELSLLNIEIKNEWIKDLKTLKIPSNEYLKNENLKNAINNSSAFLDFFFSPPLSTGEYALLYLLTQTKNYFNQNIKKIKNKNIIFILEELESFLHPEWQRRIIEFLNIVAEVVIKDNVNHKIQFILTSHTPFLIGDLPKGNIKKIEEFEIKEIENNPFGKNLLGILKENFKLSSLLSENIRNKIKDLNKKLNSKTLNSEEEKEIEFLINNIDDTLLKTIIKTNYEQYLKEKLKNDKIKKD